MKRLITSRALRILCSLILLPTSGVLAQADLSNQSVAGGPQSSVAFVNVNIVPMDKEHILFNQTLIIRNGIITQIGAAGRIQVPQGALIINGNSRLYLTPALSDMHTHLRYDEDLLLYVANGITTVRNMRGEPQHLEWREKVKRGEILGPTIYTAGPTLSGPNSGFTEVRTAEEAERQVLEQKNAGYDFIKVYDQLPKVAYEAIIASAKKLQMPVAGHVPTELGVEGVLQAKQASIEHAEQYVYHYFGDDYDETKIPYIAEATNKAGTYVCPTISFIENFILQAEDQNKVLDRSEMKYVNPETLAWWATDRKESSAQNRIINVFQNKLIRGFRDAHVKMLSGTDIYAFGLIPGISLHQELQNLVKAGLTPYQALETSTRNAGEFLGANFGTIRVGNKADLILVEGNPLDDISNLQRRAGVMVHGKWMPQAQLDLMTDRLAASFAQAQTFINLIRRNNVEAAVQTYHHTQKAGVPAFSAQSYAFSVLGGQLLQEKKIKEAIEIFKLNIEAYPNSANKYDKLASAYALDGNTKLAVEFYQKALSIDPKYPNAAAATEFIKKFGSGEIR